MQQRAYVGVRRAAAFLGMSERYLEGDFPQSLTLGRSIKRQFLPDPFPDERIPELRDNWRTWIVGNALRELDQFVSLYLDEAFDKVQQAKLVLGKHPPHYVWQRLDGITNVATKHRCVLEAAAEFGVAHVEDQRCLVSLSHARNCLSHDLGLVTPKRATDGALTIEWLGLRTIIQQGDNETVLDDIDLPFENRSNDPAHVIVRVEVTARRFAEKERIELSPDDLLGICLFYNIVIDRIAETVVRHAVQCGVKFDRRLEVQG